jgi:hypothetical protein
MPHGRAIALFLTETERRDLQHLSHPGAADPRLARRAQVVLPAAAGLKNIDIAERLGIAAHTAGRWRAPFIANRLFGLHDQCRRTAPDQVQDRFYPTPHCFAEPRLRRRQDQK